jgi:xylem cysteine proteinase
MEIESLVPT